MSVLNIDEAQGIIASNKVSVPVGVLIGGPVWQPDGGMVGGALQFDGIDDHVSTGPILNPAGGSFRVLTWIKGGAPGQTIMSQTDGSNWLCLDFIEGCLMTELMVPGRVAPGPLLSPSLRRRPSMASSSNGSAFS